MFSCDVTENIPIYDNHIHLSPRGRNIEALKEFESAGGTGLTLVTLPYDEVVISEADDFLRSYQITLSMAERARSSTELKINVAVGPYPVLILPLAERFGLEKAEKMMISGMNIAAELVASGKANAIGEIGRPHFDVSEEITVSSNRILLHGMELAAENGCPVIIHCESGSPELMKELSEMAGSASLDPGMVIKHFCPPLVRDDETHGVMPSIPASRRSVREALSKGDRFMLETDHIDDPERPGAVMSVNTVPKRVLAMLSNGEMSEGTAWKIGADIPKMYDGPKGKH
ncbi:MAG: TatD family hydrolase [Methanomassiliicoccaceae archaeon]|nr:TatD family hydrolase [Methanomassiliicoccaceae archaeon]